MNTLTEYAKREAERDSPVEHVGYIPPPPTGCSCDECYTHEMERLAFERGILHLAARLAEEDVHADATARLVEQRFKGEHPYGRDCSDRCVPQFVRDAMLAKIAEDSGE